MLEREAFDTLLEAKVLIEQWRQHYNTIRPHSALGYRPPAPQPLSCRCCEFQRLVEFSIRKHTSVAGYLAPQERQLQSTVEIDP